MIAVAALLTIFLVKEDFNPADHAQKPRRPARRAPRRRNNYAVVAALLVTAMMVLLANMSIEPIITVYIGQLGVPCATIWRRIAGIVMACSALGSMLTAARLGALADRIGGWNVIIGCLVLTGLVMIPQAFVTHWWQLAGIARLDGHDARRSAAVYRQAGPQSVDESKTGQMLGYLQSAQLRGRSSAR